MTKEILLSIRGLQITPDSQSETIETISPGGYYFRNGKHFFVYEEVMEGLQEITRNIIKVSDDYMELTKKGTVNIHMLFERNKKNVTYYYTPFGSLMIGIDAYRVEFHETENEMVIDVEYALDVNNEHISNCHIRIQVNPREDGRFKLMK